MKQAVLVIPPGCLIAGPAGADGADGAPGAQGPAGPQGPAGSGGGGGCTLTVPYTYLFGDKPAIAGSLGLVVWLAMEDGYGWRTQWAAWASHFVQGVVVGFDAGAGTVSVMMFAEATGGNATRLGVYPASLPVACVLSGSPVFGGYLGAVASGTYFVLGANTSVEETFVGCCYATVMSVDGTWLTCNWGGALGFGG